MKTLYMETTSISVGQTVSEIQKVLGECGACAVMTEYKDKEVEAVCFKVIFLDKDIPFRLPCRWKPIYDTFISRRKKMCSNREADNYIAHAKRVAWRQILRWVQAQMALVDTGMVKVHEVFLPYMQVGLNGETLSDRLTHSKFKMLMDNSNDKN